MYDEFINKITMHFSDIGSIIYSKACDFYKLYPITNEDIAMYYEILCSDEEIPKNISRENHKMCCLYYLGKENQEYQDIFVNQYIKAINIGQFERNIEYLYRIFNIIEFDKTYLDSAKEKYELLRKFANFETNFDCYIIYKYYRGYLKYKLGDFTESQKEYLEIVTEIEGNENFFLKYIKILNELLNIKKFNLSENIINTKANLNEYIITLTKLFDYIKGINPILALKLGFELFTAKIEYKEYKKSLNLLMEMKNILKQISLTGSELKNGVYYYFAISSRLGFIGILLDDKTIISKAIDKIKKLLKLIDSDNNDKNLIQLKKSYTFIQAILEFGLYNKTEFNMIELANSFQKEFIPELGSNIYANSIVNKNNKESIIIDLYMIDIWNNDYRECCNSILEECEKKLNANNYNSFIFMLFLSIIHEKIYIYTESYIKEANGRQRIEHKNRLDKYFKKIYSFINKYIDNEPFLKTPFAKSMIINIYYSYGSVLLKEKDLNRVKLLINEIIDMEGNKQINNLRQKLDINKEIRSYGLWLKLIGDYYLNMKQYDAAINRYNKAISTLKENHPLLPVIYFNCGTAYFFEGKKKESAEYLNKCINEYNILLANNSALHNYENQNEIIKKKDIAKKILDELSKEE